MNLNRRESIITEIITDPKKIHLEEHIFLTMSTLDLKETHFPKILKVIPKEIESTVEFAREIFYPITIETIIGFSLVSTRLFNPTTTYK